MSDELPAPPGAPKKPCWNIISMIFPGIVHAYYFHGYSELGFYGGFAYLALLFMAAVALVLGLVCLVIAGYRSERPNWLNGVALLVNLSLFAVVIP